MAKFKHLSKTKIEHITLRLGTAHASLNGLGALFQSRREIDFDDDELFGIGELVKGQAKELSVLEDILRCGYDSRAITKDWHKMD